MLNENAKKWVAALRSGEYKQTKQVLRDSNGFCCLGVACDLYAKRGQCYGSWMEDNTFEVLQEDGNTRYLETELNRSISDWLGLQKNEATYQRPDALPEWCLIRDNDEGKTFAEIADIIESEPEGLFVK